MPVGSSSTTRWHLVRRCTLTRRQRVETVRRLDLIVGPNGAGKSTMVDLVLRHRVPGSVFVNADLIAAHYWPQDPADHPY
jgi:ABC-type Mn2+/Zn2+ transport system ATPase subunit